MPPSDDGQASPDILNALFHHSDPRSLTAAVRKNPYPAWVFDQRTLRILEVNKAALKQYGYSRDEFLGLTAIDLRPTENIQDFLRTVVQHPSPKIVPARFLHRKKDGEVFPVQIRSRLATLDGNPVELVCAIPDREELAIDSGPSEELSGSNSLLHQLYRRYIRRL